MSYYVAESCGGAQHACPLTMKAIMKGREREGREREVQVLILWLWGGKPFLKNTSTTHFKNCLIQTTNKRILRREIARTMWVHISRRTLINMWVIWAHILCCCVEAAAMQGMPHERPNIASNARAISGHLELKTNTLVTAQQVICLVSSIV